MFFDLVILSRQHKGRFQKAWIAATRGIKYLKRNEINDINISRLCDQLKEYVISSSSVPKSRFSLRLSALLISGTLRIYRQQVTNLFDDAASSLSTIAEFPSIRLPADLESVMFATPPTPTQKVKSKGKKRQRPLEETPQSVVDILLTDIQKLQSAQDDALRQMEKTIISARAEEITLRETQPQKGQQDYDLFGEIGTFGEQEMLQLGITELSVEHTSVPPITEELPPRPQSPPRKRRKSTSSEDQSAAVLVTTVAQIHAPPPGEPIAEAMEVDRPIETLAPPTQIEQALPIVQPMEIERPMEAIVEVAPTGVQPMEVEDLEQPRRRRTIEELQADVTEKVKRDKKKIEKEMQKVFVHMKAPKAIKINSCELNEVVYVEVEVCPVPQFTLKRFNVTNLLNKFIVGDEKIRDLLVRRKSSVPSAISAVPERARETTPPFFVSPETQVPQFVNLEEEISMPVIRESAGTEMAPRVWVEEVSQTDSRRELLLAPRTTEERPTTPRSLRPATVELSTPLHELQVALAEMPSRGETPSVRLSFPSLLLESVAAPPLNRQENIVQKMLERSPLTLEEIADPPLNKLNIARAFSDLLVLAKFRYVILVSEEDSCELKHVERGPKLNA